TEPRLANATVAFDTERLEPAFRLEYGHPGPSFALTIGARLGLPPTVIARARAHLSEESRRLDALLADLARREREADVREAAARQREAEATAALARGRGPSRRARRGPRRPRRGAAPGRGGARSAPGRGDLPAAHPGCVPPAARGRGRAAGSRPRRGTDRGPRHGRRPAPGARVARPDRRGGRRYGHGPGWPADGPSRPRSARGGPRGGGAASPRLGVGARPRRRPRRAPAPRPGGGRGPRRRR